MGERVNSCGGGGLYHSRKTSSTMLVTAALVCALVYAVYGGDAEPRCSRFDFEEKVLEKLVRMEHKMSLHDKQMEAMQKDVKQQLDALVGVKESLVTTMTDLSELVAQKLEAEAAKMERLSKDVHDTMLGYNMTIQTDMIEIKERLGSAVGFHVQSVADKAPAKGDVLRYTNVITDVGGGYTPATGYFTAPVSGLYYFSVHFCPKGTKYLRLKIKIGETTIGAYSNYDKVTMHACTSGDAIAVVAAMESVHVECSYTPTGVTLSEHAEQWDTFSGVLIQRTAA